MEWAKFQERERKKEEEEKEKERVAYAQIDWHDFVVVETVDFQPNEQGRTVTPAGELGAQSCPGRARAGVPENSRMPQRALSVSVSSLLPEDFSFVTLSQLNLNKYLLCQTLGGPLGMGEKSAPALGELTVWRVDRWACDKEHLWRPPFDSGSPSPRELPSPYHPGGAGGANPHSGAL